MRNSNNVNGDEGFDDAIFITTDHPVKDYELGAGINFVRDGTGGTTPFYHQVLNDD